MGLGVQSWRSGFSAYLIEICLGIQPSGLSFSSCWDLSLTAVVWIYFSIACFKRV